MVGGQVAGLLGVKPFASRLAEVTILKVEPGGYCPSRARSNGVAVGRLTEANTSPVDARMATTAAGWATPARACSAASCTWGSIEVCTSVPGFGATVRT